MFEATSCGGVVIFRGKVLLLYKNYKNKYEGWVLPKGTVEDGESYEETALREVREETGAVCEIVKYVDKSHYTFEVMEGVVSKDVHWYLMQSDSFYSKPQKEEFFQENIQVPNFHIYPLPYYDKAKHQELLYFLILLKIHPSEINILLYK